MNKIFFATAPIAAILLAGLSGCATVTQGTSQAFQIESEPADAEAQLSNGLRCTTPCSLKLKRKAGFTVKVIKPGYETIDATIISQTSNGGGAACPGNLILGGIIGGAVDASNGSMDELKPNPLRLKMSAVAVAVPAAATLAPATSPAMPAASATVPPVVAPGTATAMPEHVAVAGSTMPATPAAPATAK